MSLPLPVVVDCLVTVGCLSTREYRVLHIIDDHAWIRPVDGGEDALKRLTRLQMVEVEVEIVEVEVTESVAPLGHYLDSFFAFPKAA
ncbi:hypothetical protein BAJUN_02110 [Bajunvirus bajun]|uniref:Uncharacterized protein n=1 Tax=Brevundimonas phage vB_BgoS-Bajun TaxID=2948594 RepID=A0A9E7STD0_9CAUD|nr:hypothetical protein BAJUN_02110 [Brevundimonas phage vB_BgoS-Bajun]